MIVTVNGEPRELPEGTTVAALLEALAARPRGIAVAVDGEVLPRGEWPARSLPDGARVEVVAAIQGG
jgi:sulfur carrier protein